MILDLTNKKFESLDFRAAYAVLEFVGVPEIAENKAKLLRWALALSSSEMRHSPIKSFSDEHILLKFSFSEL